jgi:hypothetical protein
MSNIENFLGRLSQVKGKNGHWTACCPAHGDKHPSLAIRQLEDGRILLHCFSGCDVYSVVSSVGMDLTDLFPPKDAGHAPVKAAFPASDLLRILSNEVNIVFHIAKDIAVNKRISEAYIQRLIVASERFQRAKDIANV